MEVASLRIARLLAWTLAIAAPWAPAAAPPEWAPCPRTGDSIVVLTPSRELLLCNGGVLRHRFEVSLGRSGVGKRRRGDGRTPLGTYALGAPRPSPRYGIFIPIGYPTPEQSASGFTGSAVGIHGPPRGVDASVYPVTELDWTLGCIATGTDAEVAAIAEFVRERRPRVVIR